MPIENNVSAQELKSLGKELKKQNKQANEELTKRSSKALEVTGKIGQDIKESTTKGIKGIGDKAKKTITSIPDVAMAGLDPSTQMLFGTIRSTVASSFGYVKSLGDTIKERDQDAEDQRKDTVDTLEETSEEQKDSILSVKESVDDGFGKLLAFMQGESLEDYERRREEAVQQKRLLKATEKGAEVSADVDVDDTTGISRFTIAPIFARIKPMLAMVAKGGAIALALGGLFVLFRTIKDNPVFTESIQAIKEIWEDDILPTFNRIKGVITDFIESPVFKKIQEMFDDIIEQLQNFVGRTLEDIVDLFSGVFDGIADVIEGFLTFDLKKINQGLGKIIESIIGFAVNSIDNIITAILGMFGITFEDDATLFEAIGRAVSNFFSGLRDSVTNLFSSMVGWVKNQLGFKDGEMPSILDIITGIYTAPYDLLLSVASWITGKLGFDAVSDFLGELSFADMLRSIVMAPFDLLNKVKDWLVEKLSGTKIGDFISGTLDIGKDFLASILRSVLPDPTGDYGLMDPRRYIVKAIPDGIWEFAGLDPKTGELSSAEVGDVVSGSNETGLDREETTIQDKLKEIDAAAGNVLSDAAESIGQTASNIRESVGGFVGGLFGRRNNDDDIVPQQNEIEASRMVQTSDEFGNLQAQRDQIEMERSQSSNDGGSNVYAPTNVSTSSTQVIKRLPQVASRPPSAHDLIFGA